MMRLSIDIECMRKEFVDHLIDEISVKVPNIAIRNRDDYGVLALLGDIDDIKKMLDVIYPIIKNAK